MDNIKRLTELQATLGYKQGEISPIAILGLAGECAEVMNETTFIINTNEQAAVERLTKEIGHPMNKFIDVGEVLDGLKKRIRKSGVLQQVINIEVSGDLFDKELADQLYYLNALATNRGLTLDDLARLAVEKVEAKIAATNDRNP